MFGSQVGIPITMHRKLVSSNSNPRCSVVQRVSGIEAIHVCGPHDVALLKWSPDIIFYTSRAVHRGRTAHEQIPEQGSREVLLFMIDNVLFVTVQWETFDESEPSLLSETPQSTARRRIPTESWVRAQAMGSDRTQNPPTQRRRVPCGAILR